MSGRFDGINVVVTGGARGMGEAHARGFAAEGANVLIADLNADAGSVLAAELGPAAAFTQLDVADESGWAAAVELVERRFGPVSVLVNNAGVLAPTAPLESVSLDDWQRVIATDLTGTFLGIRAAVPSLRRAGGGAIVNVSSIAGVEAVPLAAAYVASKYAVRGLTRAAALELGRDGIRVNAVLPGLVRTPMTEGVPEAATASVAISRLAEPSEVTRAVLFLASAEASYITGAEVVVDGGWLAGKALVG